MKLLPALNSSDENNDHFPTMIYTIFLCQIEWIQYILRQNLLKQNCLLNSCSTVFVENIVKGCGVTLHTHMDTDTPLRTGTF